MLILSTIFTLKIGSGKALGKERKKPTEDDIMEGCKEMLRLNIKLMRDLFDE